MGGVATCNPMDADGKQGDSHLTMLLTDEFLKSDLTALDNSVVISAEE